MQRVCYNPINFGGLSAAKVESIAMVPGGTRLFIGTGEGELLSCECRMDSSQKYTCTSSSVVRKSKERKAAYTSLQIIESWRVLVGILDGMIMAYDTHTCQCLSQLLDSKNCTLFSVHEPSSFMAVANKRKVSFYLWQGSGFVPQREIALNETPKFLHCVSGCVIVGYKRTYESINLSTYTNTHICDVEREHTMVGADIPSSSRRGACVLLSVGSHGVLVDNVRSSRATLHRERVEWSAPPVALRIGTPFNLVSLLSSKVIEVHDLGSLLVLQTINISSDLPTMGASLFSASAVDTMTCNIFKSKKGEEHMMVHIGDKISAFSMIPIHNQIMSLTADGHYEAALDLYHVSPKDGTALDVQIIKIHEMFAHVLHGKGDFEGALHNFIDANSNPAAVLSLFPEFVPAVFHVYCKDAAAQSTAFVKAAAKLSEGEARPAMTGAVLARAAAAVVTFCEHHRESSGRRANAADKIRSAGMGGIVSVSSEKATDVSSKLGASTSSSDDVSSAEVDDMIKVAELIDTALLTALVQCAPTRVDAVVRMLSKSNRCHSETSAVMLASRGKAYTEALLWLYRSNGEHRRVLAALTEERCVDSGAWSREEFFTWVTEYLRWLWFSEDETLPPLALQSMRQVIDYDVDLGMSVLVLRPKGCDKKNLGGKGLTINEVLAALGSLSPVGDARVRQEMINESINATSPRGNSKVAAAVARKHRLSCACGGIMTPLINGAALGVYYLEWLVCTGSAPANIHDEFVQMLIKSVPMQRQGVDHSKNQLAPDSGDSEEAALYKIYRRKLQHFLQTSPDYRASKIQKFLPPDFLHEHALLLSNQGRHEEVLKIYVNRLGDLSLATTYCDRIFSQLQDALRSRGSAVSASNVSERESESVYICLFRVILTAESYVSGDPALDKDQTMPSEMRNLKFVLRVAEKHYDRFPPAAFLALVPHNIPLAEIASYLHVVIEHTNTKKKNLKVLHQIMRMREVNLRTESGGR